MDGAVSTPVRLSDKIEAIYCPMIGAQIESGQGGERLDWKKAVGSGVFVEGDLRQQSHSNNGAFRALNFLGR